MNNESMVADELHRMFLGGELQITVEEDINNTSERLRSGELKLDRLSGEDAFIKETVNEVLRRVEQYHKEAASKNKMPSLLWFKNNFDGSICFCIKHFIPVFCLI